MRNPFYIDCKSTKTASVENNEIATKYFNDIRKIKVLTDEDQKKLLFVIKNGTEQEALLSRNKLIEANQRFVASIAKHLASGDNFNDLVSEGNLGFLKAIEKYDPEYKQRFLTYAQYWISKYMIDYITTTEKCITTKNPNLVYAYAAKASNAFFLENGRYPTVEELQEYLENSDIRYKFPNKTDLYQVVITSVDDIDNENKDSEDFNVELSNEYNMKTASNNVSEMLDGMDLKSRVLDIFKLLNDEEIEVLKRMYGFEGEEECIETVALIMNKPEKEIRKIHKKAMNKIRQKLGIEWHD